MLLKKIISGGQTGIDRAALDAASANHIPHGGWCPKGRQAEDGRIDSRYQLQETNFADYAVRTEWNIRDADGTLILNIGHLAGGTALTLQTATATRKPCLVVDIEQGFDEQLIRRWITEHKIEVLNVAGPRESKHPGIYKKAFNLLNLFFRK